MENGNETVLARVIAQAQAAMRAEQAEKRADEAVEKADKLKLDVHELNVLGRHNATKSDLKDSETKTLKEANNYARCQDGKLESRLNERRGVVETRLAGLELAFEQMESRLDRNISEVKTETKELFAIHRMAGIAITMLLLAALGWNIADLPLPF